MMSDQQKLKTAKGNAIKIDFDDGQLSITVQSEVEDLNVLEKLMYNLFSKLSIDCDSEIIENIYS